LDDEDADGKAKDEKGLSEIDKVPILPNLTLKSHLKRVFGNSDDDGVDRKIKDEKGLSVADEQPISPNLSFKSRLKERFGSQNYPISSQSLIDKISSSDNRRTELGGSLILNASADSFRFFVFIKSSFFILNMSCLRF